MRLNLFIRALFMIMTCSVPLTNAQETDKNPQAQMQKKKDQNLFYRRSLQVDSAKAGQVAKIQDDYKAALNAVLADSAQGQTVKRERIKALIEGKNQKLKLLLSPAQQEKMIPTTERIPSKAQPKP